MSETAGIIVIPCANIEAARKTAELLGTLYQKETGFILNYEVELA